MRAALLFSLALFLTASSAVRAELPPQTLESLRRDLRRDFPPESGTTAEIAPVVLHPNGSVSAEGLQEKELAFLARVFRNLKYGADRRIHMVTMRFTRPAAYAVRSFVEENEKGLIRMVQSLKIIENPDGTVTTVSPYFPPDGPPTP